MRVQCISLSLGPSMNSLSFELGLANLTQPPNELLELCKRHTKWKCQNGHTHRIEVIGCFQDRYVVLKCNEENCSQEWAICSLCPKQRSYMQTVSQVKRHTSNNHKERKRQRCDPQANSELNIEQTVSPSEGENIDVDVSYGPDETEPEAPTVPGYFQEVQESDTLGFTDEKSNNFFRQMHLSTSNSGGVDFLVKKSFIGSTLLASEMAKIQLPDGHSELQLRIAHLCFLLTKGQCQLLAEIMAGCYRVGCEDGYSTAQHHLQEGIQQANEQTLSRTKGFGLAKGRLKKDEIIRPADQWSTRIASSWAELRTLHVEGATAIIPNLPIPIVRTDVKDHSYVSIVDCVRHFLGFKGLDDIAIITSRNKLRNTCSTVEHASTSARAQQILSQGIARNPGLHILRSYVKLWSDDVEPNRTKSNRGSIWLLTATIATTEANGHSMHHTYPIGVAKKNHNHEPVVKKFEEDLDLLRRGDLQFYIGAAKSKAKVQFEMFAAIQDQPERRDFNCMRGGNGTHSARFGVSADHATLYNLGRLKPCIDCLRKMQKAMIDREGLPPLEKCNVCLNWDVLSDPNKLGLYPPPKNYPLLGPEDQWYRDSDSCRIVEVDSTQYIQPFCITYASLRGAVDLAHEAFCDHGWTSAQCESFLQVEGLDDNFIEATLAHSSRCISLRAAREQPGLEHCRAIIDDASNNPRKYDKIKYPAPWVRPTIELNLHPDVIMHLLFLGVVKTVTQRIQIWLSDQLKLSSFLRSTEGYLSGFLEMTIDWLAILPYKGGKLGGWVSENYLGFSRIMPWFYQNIDKATKVRHEDEPPPNLPQKKWTNKQNKYWLHQRGLDTSGKKHELADRVAKYLGLPNPPPARADIDLLPSDVEKTVLALSEVLRCVMKMSVTPDLVNRTRYATRLFLSSYDNLCSPMKQKTPPVLSSYNFICMLNLPTAMETFGPLRCLWEGGPRGEGFARFSKPLIKEGVYQLNWHYNLLTRLLRAKTLDLMMPKPAVVMSKPSGENALQDRKGSFHRYDSEFSFYSRFEGTHIEGIKPISVVLAKLSNNEVNLLGVVGGYNSVIQVSYDLRDPVLKFGLYYFNFEPTSKKAGLWKNVCENVTDLGFGMLLPLLEQNKPGRFALISSNWEALTPAASITDLL